MTVRRQSSKRPEAKTGFAQKLTHCCQEAGPARKMVPVSQRIYFRQGFCQEDCNRRSALYSGFKGVIKLRGEGLKYSCFVDSFDPLDSWFHLVAIFESNSVIGAICKPFWN